jgi:DNA-binding beta-propeller fold protein YncE
MGCRGRRSGSGLIGNAGGFRADLHSVLYSLAGALCALAGVLVFSSAPALAARGHVFSNSFGSGPCVVTPLELCAGKFDDPSGVAVNEATGDVYVVDKGNDRVEYFNSTGTKLEGEFSGSGLLMNEGSKEAGSGGQHGEILTGQFSEPEGIAIDNSCRLHKPEPLTETTTPLTCKEFDPSNGDVYVVDTGHDVIDKFSAVGEYIGQLTETSESRFVPLVAVGGQLGVEIAVGTSGSVWVRQQGSSSGPGEIDKFTNEAANRFSPPAILTPTIFFPAPGFAVDAEDNFYIGAEFTSTFIFKLNSVGEALNREFTHEPSTAVAVELASNDVYIDNGTTVGEFSPSGEPLERLGSGDLTSGSGIGVSSTAEEVYVADSAADKVDIFVPKPPGPPTVESESVSEVASGSATFSAQINPQGAGTEYHFEYDTSKYTPNGPSHGITVPIPDASIGSGFKIQEARIHLQDLAPDREYHFRVVAQNNLGPAVDGPDRTFITQGVGGEFALPDGRAWELVSPPDKHGAELQPIFEEGGVVQASESGSAITYVANGPIETEPEGNLFLDTQVLSMRGADGWLSKDIATPNDAVSEKANEGHESEYHFFSSDLSLGLVEPSGGPALSPAAPAYLRDSESGNYQPLPDGGFEGATPDLSHIVFSGGGGLQEWAEGQLQLVSVLPESEGGTPALGAAALGDKKLDVRHAISSSPGEDGARIVWTGEDNGVTHLYMRDTTKGTMGETVRLDIPENPANAGTGEPRFQTASESGSKVFFTDEQRLTSDSTAGAEDPDLYVFEVTSAGGEPLAGKVTDLTVDKRVGETASVQGMVIGASEDGSYVYYVATGVLGSNENSEEEKALPGADNLYVQHYNGTSWEGPVFIVSLSSKDANDWGAGPTQGGSDLGAMTSRVSPSGEYLAFMSEKSLTGYDNVDANSDVSDEEVFLYGASASRVVCASCNPTGARPAGVFDPGGFPGLLVDSPENWQRRWLAGSIPGWTKVELSHALYQSRYLSDTGRLFFNSADGLVPQDKNGLEDVYEYEPDGEGSCKSSSATFSEKSGGCIGLISSGTSSEESAFLDASASGNDVFFLTASKLVTQDFDTSLDVYDAHVCSEAIPCLAPLPVAPPPCSTGDSCKAAPSLQPAIFGASGSATFSGAGNIVAPTPKPVVTPKRSTRAQKLAKAIRACAKKPKKKRAACEAQARKRYGAKVKATGKKSARRGQ